MRPVAMPISAPKPNSPPSANWVEALCSTMARIDLAQEALGRGRVLGDDRVGVVRAVASRCGRWRRRRRRRRCTAMMASRYSVAPVLLGRRRRRADRRLHGRVAAHLAAGIEQRLRRAARRCVAGAGAVDQQRLGGAADAGAPHLGVERRSPSPCRGRPPRCDVDVADAFEVREHRHARLRLHARHEALAAARHDDVDARRRARRASRRRRRGRWSARAGSPSLGQAGRAQALAPAQRAMAPRGAEALRAAAQDRGVAGLEAERAGVGRHVRAALEDDADDAERRRDALDRQAVRPLQLGEHAADGIGQIGDALDRVGDRREPVSSSVRRSMKAAACPFAFASATSSALAARMSAADARMRAAMALKRGVLLSFASRAPAGAPRSGRGGRSRPSCPKPSGRPRPNPAPPR